MDCDDMIERINDIMFRIESGLAMIRERVPDVLADPRAYPQESMLLAAIVGLVLILAVLFVIALIDIIRGFVRRRRLGLRVNHRIRMQVIAVAVLIVAAGLIGIALSPGLVSVSARCGSCHATEQAVAAWEAGVHADASCYDCHASGGIFGSLRASATGAIRYITSESRASTATPVASESVFSDRCLRCHQEILDGVMGVQIRMRHSDVVEEGFACTTCHPFSGHGPLALEQGRSIERSMMSICLACHDGVRADSDCLICHEGRPSDSLNPRPAGNTPAGIRCSGCHSEDTTARCIDCHGLELPHPTVFFSEHAGRSWANPGLCATCHESASSSLGCGCHADANIHGTYDMWFPRHGPAATTNWPGGCNCHDLSFCGLCHLSSPL